MKRRNLYLSALAVLSGAFLPASRTSAQPPCTPVVYAFRHAEDEEKKTGLKPIGEEHARTYVGMLDQLEAERNYCPVGFVYSMYNKKPNKDPGTENPFQTAEPLAFQACYVQAVFRGDIRPDISCGQAPGFSDVLPHMQLGDAKNPKFLYEFLGATDAEAKAGDSASNDDLRQQLVANASSFADATPGLSSAIFWTSQGLNTVGLAIADGTNIPTKSDPGGPPPRNAVYIFEFKGGTFSPPKDVNQFLQCFNFNLSDPTQSPGGTNFYCRKFPGDLPNIKDFMPLEGKICDVTGLPVAKRIADSVFLGPCQ
jgi:hypothetical protein